jgi:hypothetical protein
MEIRRKEDEVARQTLRFAFPHRDRAEQRYIAGQRSIGCFCVLPEWLAGDAEYEIVLTGIPEGVLAVSAWLQEAEDGVPIFGTARFYTDGIALDVRHGVLRVLGGHDFGDWSLPAGIMLLLHW